MCRLQWKSSFKQLCWKWEDIRNWDSKRQQFHSMTSESYYAHSGSPIVYAVLACLFTISIFSNVLRQLPFIPLLLLFQRDLSAVVARDLAWARQRKEGKHQHFKRLIGQSCINHFYCSCKIGQLLGWNFVGWCCWATERSLLFLLLVWASQLPTEPTQLHSLLVLLWLLLVTAFSIKFLAFPTSGIPLLAVNPIVDCSWSWLSLLDSSVGGGLYS